MWLFIAFLAVPLIEISLFIQIGGLIGLGWTLVTVVVTAIIGTWLVRTQGMIALSQLRTSFADARDPTEPLAHGAMILFSGALLLTPGFFTDGIGFLLLIPAIRSSVYRFIRARIKVQSFSTHETQRHEPPGDVIDADYIEIDTTPPKPGKPSGWTKH